MEKVSLCVMRFRFRSVIQELEAGRFGVRLPHGVVGAYRVLRRLLFITVCSSSSGDDLTLAHTEHGQALQNSSVEQHAGKRMSPSREGCHSADRQRQVVGSKSGRLQ